VQCRRGHSLRLVVCRTRVQMSARSRCSSVRDLGPGGLKSASLVSCQLCAPCAGAWLSKDIGARSENGRKCAVSEDRNVRAFSDAVFETHLESFSNVVRFARPPGGNAPGLGPPSHRQMRALQAGSPLVGAPDAVKASVPLAVFHAFVAALEGRPDKITEANFRS
jgi:hypothetical protein